MHIETTLKQHTDNLLSVSNTVKFMFIVQIAIYHYDMYVKVAYDNFNNKRRYDDDDHSLQCYILPHAQSVETNIRDRLLGFSVQLSPGGFFSLRGEEHTSPVQSTKVTCSVFVILQQTQKKLLNWSCKSHYCYSLFLL